MRGLSIDPNKCQSPGGGKTKIRVELKLSEMILGFQVREKRKFDR